MEGNPKLRTAGREFNWLHIGPFCFVIYKPSSSRGSVEILEGFPRPVGAVVNQLLVFHRFHQRRHFPWLCWPARTLPVLDIVARNAASAGYMSAPGTHRFDCARLLDPDSQPRTPPPP